MRDAWFCRGRLLVLTQHISRSTQVESNYMIQLNHVTYTSPDQPTPALADFSAMIQPGEFVLVVGPSGAGKSTLLNFLTAQKHGIYADDKLFATLDPTTKRVRLPGGGWALLTDTVGFIQKLPHNLVAAFRSTLEETAHADLILHIHDLSSPQMKLQHAAVQEALKDLELAGIPVINVYNKIDAVPGYRDSFELLRRNRPVFVSALTGEGIEELMGRIQTTLAAKWGDYELTLPAGRQKLLSEIYKSALVKNAVYGPKEIKVSLKATKENYQRFLKLLDKG